MAENPKRVAAAQVLATGGTKAEAARFAGVDRATVSKWVKNPAFILLVEKIKPELSETAVKGLHDLIPQALSLLKDSLGADSEITGSRARIALDIVKAAASIAQTETADGPTDLERRLAQLDAEDSGLRGD